jgi:hypothetical protein
VSENPSRRPAAEFSGLVLPMRRWPSRSARLATAPSENGRSSLSPLRTCTRSGSILPRRRAPDPGDVPRRGTPVWCGSTTRRECAQYRSHRPARHHPGRGRRRVLFSPPLQARLGEREAPTWFSDAARSSACPSTTKNSVTRTSTVSGSPHGLPQRPRAATDEAGWSCAEPVDSYPGYGSIASHYV